MLNKYDIRVAGIFVGCLILNTIMNIAKAVDDWRHTTIPDVAGITNERLFFFRHWQTLGGMDRRDTKRAKTKSPAESD